MSDPLTPDIWFQRIAYVAMQLDSNLEDVVERCLRHMVHLCQLAPGPLGDLARPRIDEDTFEFLIDAKNYDAASLGLISNFAACSVAYEESSSIYKAAIGLPALNISVEAIANTITRATLTAWVQCFLAVFAEYGSGLEIIDDAIRHKDQSEQHQPPTEH